MSLFQSRPRIQYNSRNIDFDNLASFKEEQVPSRVRTPVASGARSIATFHTKQKVMALLDHQEAQKIVNEIRQLHAYAQDGASFAFIRDRDLQGYYPFEYSLKNQANGVEGVFSRGATAYYLDGSTGLLKAATGNNPRFTPGKYGVGMKISGNRTNLVTHPSDFGDASYSGTAPTIGSNTTDTKDPAGANNGDRLSSASPSERIFTSSIACGTNDAVMHLWLKSAYGDISNITLAIFSTSTGVLEQQTIPAVGTEWKKYSIVYESMGSVAGDFAFGLNYGGGSVPFYAYGMYGVAGVDVLFDDDDPDPLATSASTLLSERYTVDVSNLGPEAFTLSFWFSPVWSGTDHPEVTLFQIELNQDYKLKVYFPSLSDSLTIRVDGLTSGSANGTFSFVAGQWYHVAVVVDSSLAGSKYLLYVNGSLFTQIGGLSVPQLTPDELAIGARTDITFPAYGTFCDLSLWNYAMSVGEIKSIYARQLALGLERNYYAALELLVPGFAPENIKDTDMFRYLLDALEVIS